MIPDYIYKHALESDWVKRDPGIKNLLKETRVASDRARKKRSFGEDTPGFVDHVVFDCHNTTTPDKTPVAQNDENRSSDPMVAHILKQSKTIDQVNTDVLKRNGWSGKHSDHICNIHYDKQMDNAFFDGKTFNFGDGSGTLFTPLGYSLCVHAHEYGHGFVQTTSKSRYFGESGALNEGGADWFGITFVCYVNKIKIKDCGWLIGDDIIAPQAKAQGWKALRTFTTEKAYPQDPQPKFVKDKKLGPTEISDNFGVHIWSGIVNHAFYLYAMGQDQHEYLHEGIFQVFVYALAKCGEFGGFKKFTDAVLQVCLEREPKTLPALKNALKTVGLLK